MHALRVLCLYVSFLITIEPVLSAKMLVLKQAIVFHSILYHYYNYGTFVLFHS